MQRREALRLLAATAALPILSRDAFSLFREVHQQLAEAPALKTLNPHQNATVTAMSELIAVTVAFWCGFSVFRDRKSTRLNSSHSQMSYAVFCLQKKKQ